MSPMLRVNISIPSDLYEECQQACDKQKISFSQMVRTALMNHIQDDSATQPSLGEKEVTALVEQLLGTHRKDFQKMISEIDQKYALIFDKNNIKDPIK